MRFFIIIILGLLIGGCSASKHIEIAKRKDPSLFDTTETVKIVSVMVPIDTTFNIPLSDFLHIDTTPNIRYKEKIINNKVYVLPSFDTIIKQNNGLETKVWMNEGNLGVYTKLDSLYKAHLIDSIKTEIEQKNKLATVTIKEKCSLKEWLKSIGIGLVVLIGLIIIINLIQFIKK